MQFSLLTKPSLEDEKIKNICNEHNIEYLAYSPLALGILTIPPNKSPKPSTFLRQKLFERILPKTQELRELLASIAKKYSASQAQVALNWCVRNPQIIAIPKASSKKRILENLESTNFQLSDSQIIRFSD